MLIRRYIISLSLAVPLASIPLLGAPVKQTDAEFLKMVAEADMITAHIGQMAQDRLTTPGAKDFAKELANDHTSDYTQVSQLAAKCGDVIPKTIDNSSDLRTIHGLDKDKGKAFEHAFLTQETTEHQRLLNAYKEEAKTGTNPDIRSYASKTLPVIEGHLHQAEDLAKGKSNKS